VRWALGKYGRRGSILIDPFTGSGTTQVEALARGISSVGIDIDPVACLIAEVKTLPIDAAVLRDVLEQIRKKLGSYLKAHASQEGCPGSDISLSQMRREAHGLWIPPIPNITHWFRHYVIVDLAALFWAIENLGLSPELERFFRACAGSIIRAVSNADPAPVSGLEVTSVQAEKNKKRKIRVFKSFFKKAEQVIRGMNQLRLAHRKHGNQAKAWVVQGDSLRLSDVLAEKGLPSSDYPLVITSPPYCRSVEYSRRHRLEMYWLKLINSPEQHIELKHKYLGRGLVRECDWNDGQPFQVKKLNSTIEAIAKKDSHKARAVRHYFTHMSELSASLWEIVGWRATVVLVLGDSVCCGVSVATATYVSALIRSRFKVVNRFSYALRNQYMQYGLWNGEGIKEEHILILKPR